LIIKGFIFRDAILELVRDEKEKTHQVLSEWREMQLQRPYTLNTSQFADDSNCYLTQAKHLRAKVKAPITNEAENLRLAKAYLAKLGNRTS